MLGRNHLSYWDIYLKIPQHWKAVNDWLSLLWNNMLKWCTIKRHVNRHISEYQSVYGKHYTSPEFISHIDRSPQGQWLCHSSQEGCTDPALILHSCQLSPWTRLSWDDAGECHKQGWPGNSVLCFEHPGVLERCFMSKAVPKSKAPFPAASNAAPQPLCKEGREATGGEWAADREEPAAHTAPAPMCQAAAPVALGAALNLFQSTCHCPS